jgi:hypothetical protein
MDRARPDRRKRQRGAAGAAHGAAQVGDPVIGQCQLEYVAVERDANVLVVLLGQRLHQRNAETRVLRPLMC